MCAVGGQTLRASGAEEILEGQRPDAELYKRAGERAAQECEPAEDARGPVEYKRDLVKVLVARALETAVERAGGGA
jgi:carbon-monoxide dehydrogenase medium subunit